MKRIIFCSVLAMVMFGQVVVRANEPTTAPSTPPTTQPDSKNEFLRFVDDGHGGGTLQVAERVYANNTGATVHLIGAVHVGDKAYYQSLNDEFKNYDALLYELVTGHEGQIPHPGEDATSGVSMVQHWMKDVLHLDFQLDDIDYTAKNFVHADMDWQTFEAMESQRGESIWSIMLQSMMDNMAKQAAGAGPQKDFTLVDLIVILQAPDRARQLKLLLGQQFGDIEDQLSGLSGPNGSVILTERNKKALSVLKDQLAAGKKKLAIFYGAAHLGDMSKRLEAMGFKESAAPIWHVAWDMTTPANSVSPTTGPATQPATNGGSDGR